MRYLQVKLQKERHSQPSDVLSSLSSSTKTNHDIVVGESAIAAGGALVQDVATKAALDYMDVVLAGLDTSGTVSNKKQVCCKIQKLADKHSTLGYPKQPIRQTFAMSPLMKRTRETTLVEGIVYIACIPPGKGKTASCYIPWQTNVYL